mmetsp:Transcript_59933/g.99473  ORF Transcript_59933/g.99473 Transcript_59933/m.99473 type:complete len:97 (-) Transcript_59933:690-980(-)
MAYDSRCKTVRGAPSGSTHRFTQLYMIAKHFLNVNTRVMGQAGRCLALFARRVAVTPNGFFTDCFSTCCSHFSFSHYSTSLASYLWTRCVDSAGGS